MRRAGVPERHGEAPVPPPIPESVDDVRAGCAGGVAGVRVGNAAGADFAALM